MKKGQNFQHAHFEINSTHYENMPIQIYRKSLTPKNENFQIKNANIFLISAQNIDCKYWQLAASAFTVNSTGACCIFTGISS